MYVMEAREDVEGTLPQDKGRLQQLLDANSALEERCIEVCGDGGTVALPTLRVACKPHVGPGGPVTLKKPQHVLSFISGLFLWPRPVQDLKAAFAGGDLHHAAELTTQLRYICRIREAIVDKM